MKTSQVSFVSLAEMATDGAFIGLGKRSAVLGHVCGRVVAVATLSLGGAADIVFHGAMVVPAVFWAVGSSIVYLKWNVSLPWQHLQRVKNAVSPLLFGSVFGLIHPMAGIFMSEPCDKHIAMAALAANVEIPGGEREFSTPCSPVQTLSMVKNIGRMARLHSSKKHLFSDNHMRAINKAQAMEKDLEAIQAQEYLHQITNLSLHGRNWMIERIASLPLSSSGKMLAIRALAITFPVLAAIDLVAAVFLEGVMLIAGVQQLLTGRGPIYTEITQNPLFHVKFIIHAALKTVGTLLSTFVWPFSMEGAYKTSQFCTQIFYSLQMNYIMLKLRYSMWRLKEGEMTMVPIVFGLSDGSSLSLPFNSMHKTYVVIEKKDEAFNLYWINREIVTKRSGATFSDTIDSVRKMLDTRFPYINDDRLDGLPPKPSEPYLGWTTTDYMTLHRQGTDTNCVISNLFGAFDCIDKITNRTKDTTPRYTHVRSLLFSAYDFYKWEYTPFIQFDTTFTPARLMGKNLQKTRRINIIDNN